MSIWADFGMMALMFGAGAFTAWLLLKLRILDNHTSGRDRDR